jgi:amino acid transporter
MQQPVVFMIVFFILFFGFIVLMRFINYKETLYMAEKGLTKPDRRANGSGRGYLIWGILIAAFGLAIMFGMMPLITSHSSIVMEQPVLLLGLIPLFIGLGLILIYYLLFAEKKEDSSGSKFPPAKDLTKEK